MRLIRNSAAFAVLFTATTMISSPAHAWLRFCNNTRAVQNVSVGFENRNSDWQSEGWWVLDPGECKNALGGDLERRYYYYRIKSGGTARSNDADYKFCTKTEAYTIIGDKNCEGRGYHSQFFKRVDTGNAKNFTINIE